MVTWIENILIGIREWVAKIIDDKSVVISSHINKLNNDLQSNITRLDTTTANLTTNKQDKLTAGDNISLSNSNVISARSIRILGASNNTIGVSYTHSASPFLTSYTLSVDMSKLPTGAGDGIVFTNNGGYKYINVDGYKRWRLHGSYSCIFNDNNSWGAYGFAAGTSHTNPDAIGTFSYTGNDSSIIKASNNNHNIHLGDFVNPYADSDTPLVRVVQILTDTSFKVSKPIWRNRPTSNRPFRKTFQGAQGDYSVSIGYSTIAGNDAECALGSANISHWNDNTFGNNGNTMFSVGISNPSIDYTDWAARTNGFEIMQNGDMYVYGVGNYVGKDIKTQNNTIKTLQETITSLESRIAALESQS